MLMDALQPITILVMSGVRTVSYTHLGSKVYGVPYEDCREFYPDGTVNAEGKHRRTTMKSVLLGIMYERGAKAIGEQFEDVYKRQTGLELYTI